MRWLAFFTLFLGSPVAGQGLFVAPVPVDTSQLATKAELAAQASAAATAAANAAQAANAAATAQSTATTAKTTADATQAALSGYATTGAVTAVQTAVMAAMPKAATSLPPSEQVGGSVGTAGTYRPSDAANPRISRAGTTTTDASGNWAITWSSALAQVPVALPIPVDAGAQPVMCTVATRTTTGATGRCFRSQLLPSTLTLLSALVNFNVLGGAASNVTVQVLAIPPTQ